METESEETGVAAHKIAIAQLPQASNMFSLSLKVSK